MKNLLRGVINLASRIMGIGLLIFSVYYGTMHGAHPVHAGIVHLPSIIVVSLGLLGIMLASYRIEIFFQIVSNMLSLSPTLLRIRHDSMEKSMPTLADIYYEHGASKFLEEVNKRKLGPIWKFLATRLESKMPIHDIQMFLQDFGKKENESLFTQIRVLQSLATIAPAVGMTGTILGLIKLLKDLNQFDSLGSNMALAFITALYGLLFGNFIFIPIVNRLNAGREEMMNLISQSLFWLEMIQQRKPAHYLEESPKA